MTSLKASGDKLIAVAKKKKTTKPLVLVLDDDKQIVDLLVEFINQDGFAEALGAYSIQGAYNLHRDFDLLVVDIYLNADRGDMFVKDYSRRHPSAKVMLITARNIPPGESALRKPFHLETFMTRVKQALKG